MGAFWHPFADMGAVDGNELVIERGDGVYVWDESGKRYLDAIASLWYCNVGYGRREIADAVAAQTLRLHAYHTFGDLANRPAMELAERIAGFAPLPGSKVFFTSGGSDSVDTAAKLARRYFHETGEPQRTVLITREWAYHGMHTYGTSLAGMSANLEHYGDLVLDVVKVAWDSADELASTIDGIGAERCAQHPRRLVLSEPRIAVVVQHILFAGEYGAFAIDIDAAAFHEEGRGKAADAEVLGNPVPDRRVPAPGSVLTAPGIEVK